MSLFNSKTGGVGMDLPKIYTIGFSGKSAEQFFELLNQHKVRRVLDVRLWNRSQLAGFTKAGDLQFFLRSILSVDYFHLPILAPTKQLLDGYKKKQISWGDYESAYLKTLIERNVETALNSNLFTDACLLCSEPTAQKCHRRLAAEYLQSKWGFFKQPKEFNIIHL